MAERESVWARRFIGAAIVLGAVAFVLLAGLVYLTLLGEAGQSPSRIVAGGSVGTWLLVGFSGYLIGVVAVGLSALFYYYIEVVRGTPYTGTNSGLAWAHLILLNAGILGGSGLMMLAGFVGGAHLLTSETPPPAVYGEVHELVVGYVVPIALFIAVGGLGALLGGVGYLRAWFGRGVVAARATR